MFWEGGRVPWFGEWGRDLVGSVLLSEAALRANACSASGLLRLPGGTPPAVQVLINRTQSLYLYPVTGLSERADKGEPLILPHPSVSFGQKDEGVMQSEGTVCVPCGHTARPGRDGGCTSRRCGPSAAGPCVDVDYNTWLRGKAGKLCWWLVGQNIMAAAAKGIQFNTKRSKKSMYRWKGRRQITFVSVTFVGLVF